MREMPKRRLPAITPMNQHFWCGGKDGRLHILRCADCGWYVHPYAARCTRCGSAEVSPQPVSGRARIVGFTINHQTWVTEVPVPYVVALVELTEQSNLRLMTNMPDCSPDEVTIDMDVEVYFEQQDEVFVPLFRPVLSET